MAGVGQALAAALGAALLLPGCAGAGSQAKADAPAAAVSAPAAAPSAPAVNGAPAADARSSRWPSEIRFVDDNYAVARTEARATNRPIFVDSWATWCHSCLSMRSFVLPDAGLRSVKDAVVWLSIETEQEGNRAFVEKFPAEGLPTFLIIDPDDEQVLGRWLGSGSANEMRGFVQAGVQAYQAKRGGPAESAAAQAQREGDLASMKRDYTAAAAAFRRAAELTSASDEARAARLDLLAGALSHNGTQGAIDCIKLGLAELDQMPANAVGADFAATVAGCAQELKGGADANELRTRAVARLVAMTDDPSVPFSVDDRSDVQASLASLQSDTGDQAAAQATLRKRERLLEQAAAAAPDAETAATFDAHRTDCYVQLGELDKAEALLSQREKDLPADYNPPARLARVLLEAKKLAAAEGAVDRALARMTKGPRRVGILGLKAKILAAEGKPREAVLREELQVMHDLPATQRPSEAQIKSVEAEIQKERAARKP